MKLVPIVWCLLAAALFGFATPASKYLLSHIGPIRLAGLLYLGAALAMLPLSRRGGSRSLDLRPVNLGRLIGAIVFGGVVGPLLLLLGLRSSPAASAALWLNLESVATAVLAWALFREHIGRRTALAVVLVLAAGVALASPQEFGMARAAVLIGLACVAWGLDNNFTALIDGLTPAQTTLIKGLVAGTFNLGLSLRLEPASVNWAATAAALLLGALCYGFSIQLYIAGAQQLGATRAQMLFASAPFIGVALSWIALHERVQAAQVAAGAMMALGLWIMVNEHHAHRHVHPALEHTHVHVHEDEHHDHCHEEAGSAARHTHPHRHGQFEHDHSHNPDLHHRHGH